MSLLVREYLQHILDETQYLLDQAQGLDEQTFLHDETLKRAFVRSLEVIGEAAKHIPDEVRPGYSQIEWRTITGMRDRLIHAYFGVDYEIVWDMIGTNIPTLQRDTISILERERN